MIQDLMGQLTDLVRAAKARAWEEGYRHGRGKVSQAQVDLVNPYVQEEAHP